MQNQSEEGRKLLQLFLRTRRQGIFSRLSAGKLRPQEFILLYSVKRLEKLRLEEEKSAEGKEKGISVSELSRFVGSSLPGVSQTLRSLSEKGLIERLNKDSDRRVIFVKISSSGYELMKQIEEPFFELFDLAAKRFGKEATESLTGLLSRFLNILLELEEEMGKAPCAEESSEGEAPCGKPL